MFSNFSAGNSGLKITVGDRTMSVQNQKLSDRTKNTLDILPDEKNSRQNEMSDQIMLLSDHKLKLSDQNLNRRKLILYTK